MLTNWQFNVLFFVGVGGAILALLGPEFGLNFSKNPTALTGIGAILAYILTQRKSMTKPEEKPEEKKDDQPSEGVDDGLD